MPALRALLVFFLFLFVAPVFAGTPPPPPPSTTGSTPSCWPPPCIPVDGGISVLIAAGALYGAKKFYENRKKNDNAA